MAERATFGCLGNERTVGKGRLRKCRQGRYDERNGVQMISQGETHETLPEFESTTSFAWK